MDVRHNEPPIVADERKSLPVFPHPRWPSYLRSSVSLSAPRARSGKGWWLVGLLLAATIWGLVDVRRRGYPYPDMPQEHKSDLTVYTGAGAAFFNGQPPYAVRNPRGWTYVYPPILAIVVAPLHVLPMQDQVTVWFFLCLLMCWGTYREATRIVAIVRKPDDRPVRRSRWSAWLGAMAATAVVLPTLNCLQRGQVSIVVLYLLLLGLRLILGGQTLRAFIVGGIVLALSVAIKIIPILPVAFLLLVQLVGFLRQQWRQRPATGAQFGRQLAGSAFGVGLGLALFFFLLPAALIGWNANLRHLDTWSHLVLSSAADSTATPGFEKDTHSVRNQCLGNAVYRLGNFGAYVFAGGPEDPLVDDDNPPPRLMDAPSVNTCLLFVRLTLLLALLLVGLRLGAHGDAALSQAAGFGLACAALLVVSPVARNHYFLLLAPAVLFPPLWLDRLGHGRQAAILAVVPGVLVLLQYILMPYVGRIGLLGLGTAGWVMAAMVLVDRASRSARDATAVPNVPAARLTEAA
jgi:hypothetical protein